HSGPTGFTERRFNSSANPPLMVPGSLPRTKESSNLNHLGALRGGPSGRTRRSFSLITREGGNGAGSRLTALYPRLRCGRAIFRQIYMVFPSPREPKYSATVIEWSAATVESPSCVRVRDTRFPSMSRDTRCVGDLAD